MEGDLPRVLDTVTMEDSSELLSEENKVSMEKNKKRKLKTPAQVMGLEKFYNEHKYPTEEMKLELAAELRLTEKQVSGWFCHRRLKDKRLLKHEAYANGRQDRSSGVIQDRVSGLGQDSCGSTKHVDYKHLDPKEVESQGLLAHAFLSPNMTYEHRSHYRKDVDGMDDTSSESSSSLQDRFLSQGQDPCNMEHSRYVTPDRGLPPINPKVAINMEYKPSGYLKVKGEIENAAITAVKKQLGMHYQEDGPPLGIEFDPIPPGAFACQTSDPVHEPYYVANTAIPNIPQISAVKRQPSLSSRYDSYNAKLSSQDSHMEGKELGSLQDSDCQDKKTRQHMKQRPNFHGYTHPLPGRNSTSDLYEDSTGEASAYNSNKNHRMGTKHGIEGMRSDSASNLSDQYEGKLVVKQADLLHGYDDVNPKNVRRSEYIKSKPSNSIRNHHIFVDAKERGLSTSITKEEKLNGDGKARKRCLDRARMLPNEIKVVKQVRADLPQQHNVKRAPVDEKKLQQNQRSAMEVPSSFSEDETAETSSSLD